MQMDNFYSSALVHEVEKKDYIGTLCANRKNVHPILKSKKLKKERHCIQHSGDAAVLVWQDKQRVSVISMYHKEEIHMGIMKANQEETKLAVVCDYSDNILGLDLKGKMLHLYLAEQKKCTRWHLKVFKRLLSGAIHNAVIMHWSLQNNKNKDSLKFRLSLAHSSGVPCTVHGHPSVKLSHVPSTGKKAKPKKKMSGVHEK